jgi:hypothetical protein
VERDEHRRADALDHYWDAVLRGETPARPTDVDDVAAAVIALLGEPRLAPPVTAAQERGRARIAAQAKALEDPMHTMTLPQDAISPNALPVTSWSPGPSTPRWGAARFRWAGQLATVALLLLTLGFGYLALGPGRPQSEQLAGIPALVAPATPAPGPLEVVLEPVLATTLPAELVPTSGNLSFDHWHAVLEPDTRASFPAEDVDCCPGPQISHVMEGELTLSVAGPLRVFRGSDIASGAARAEEVPPGTEIVLHPGDTALYDSALPAEYANRGAGPVHIIGSGLLAGATSWTPMGLPLIDGNEESSVPPLPPGPVEVMLVRAILPPGGIVPAPLPGSLVLEVGAIGDASIAQRADASLRNIGEQTETIYVITFTPIDAGSGTPTA